VANPNLYAAVKGLAARTKSPRGQCPSSRHLLRVRLAALGSSALPGRPATTSGARASYPCKAADSTAFGHPGLAKIQGVVSTNVTDGPNKVYVGNLPNHLKPDQVKELVEMFGEQRAL